MTIIRLLTAACAGLGLLSMQCRAAAPVMLDQIKVSDIEGMLSGIHKRAVESLRQSIDGNNVTIRIKSSGSNLVMVRREREKFTIAFPLGATQRQRALFWWPTIIGK